MKMDELFELFVKIAERYMYLSHGLDFDPGFAVIDAIDDVVRERGYTIVTTQFLESLSDKEVTDEQD